MKASQESIEQQNKMAKMVADSLSKTCGNLKTLTPEQLSEVRKVYLSSMVKAQSDLVQKLGNPSTWTELTNVVQEAITFAAELQTVVLDPPRSELLGRLRKLALTLGIFLTNEMEDWFKDALRTANQSSLDELKEKFTSLESLLLNPVGRTVLLVKRMFTNELNQLKTLERNTANVSAWMGKAIQAFLQCVELQKIEQEIKGSIDSKYMASPQKEIALIFFETVESVIDKAEVQTLGFERALAIWKQTKEDVTYQWAKLTPKLDRILQQYTALISSAKPLVIKKIGEWQAATLADIVGSMDTLLELVGQIIKYQDVLNRLAVLSSSHIPTPKILPQELKPLKVSLTQLIKDIDTMVSMTSLSDCIVVLEKLTGSYNLWVNQVASFRNGFVLWIQSWVALCEKENIKCTQDLDNALKTFEATNFVNEPFNKFVERYLSITTLVEDSREELRKTLTGEQVTLLEVIAGQLTEGGSIALRDLEAKLGKLNGQHMDDLLELDKRHLLSMNITVKEG